MVRMLIIGYGNPLRGDDGLGVVVADRLAAQLADHADVEILAVHQLLPELAEPISKAAYVIFVDAREGEAPPGTIDIQPLHAQAAQFQLHAMNHHLDARSLLAAARILYGYAPSGELITVVGGAYGYGEGLSVEVEAAVPIVLQYILAKINQICGV